MSTQVHEENTGTTTTEAPAAGSEGGSAQGSEGADSSGTTEGSVTPGENVEGEGGDPDPAAVAAAAVAAAFKPREKFKSRVYGSDEQKEHDVPAWMKSAIKDEATDKEAIELLEKAYGLEPVKQARAEAVKERDFFKSEHTKVTSTIADVRKTYQRGDIDAFLDKLAIPHERMLQWALDKVNYSQLPPEQQKMVDERRDSNRRAWAAEERLDQSETSVHETTRTAKQSLLQSALTRPDVSTFAQAFDDRSGPGAFFKEVVAQGQLAWAQSQGKEDLSPDQAIERVIARWKPFITPAVAAPTAAAAGSQAGGGSPAVTTASPASVIPNVQGRTSSPMKSKPRSIEDLKKLGRAAQGA